MQDVILPIALANDQIVQAQRTGTFFVAADARRLTSAHVPRLSRLLDAIDHAEQIGDLDVPGWYLYRLKGDMRHLYSQRASGNWRLTFEFIDGDAHIVNLEDYH